MRSRYFDRNWPKAEHCTAQKDPLTTHSGHAKIVAALRCRALEMELVGAGRVIGLLLSASFCFLAFALNFQDVFAEEVDMGQEPRIEQLERTRLIGVSLEMSRANDQTPTLWRSFMPRRQTVLNRASQDFMSMQVYPNGPKQIADPSAKFTKWAVVQVENFETVPDGMETYTLVGGLYAVFQHNGPATDLSTVMYIFQEWLPKSNYVLDDREHFEVLPSDYEALDPNAHEEFWIPVRPR